MPQQDTNPVPSQTRKTSENQQPDQKSLTRERREGQSPLSPYGFGLSAGDLLRMSPFAVMRRMGEEFDRMFASSERAWAPAIEVSHQGGEYKITAELPGIDPKDVKVEIEEKQIILQGERESQSTEERTGVRHTERRYGSFYRNIPLPEGAEAQKARARFENGMLEISVPVTEQSAQRRQIPIEAKRP
jgi:HSP20 family protein